MLTRWSLVLALLLCLAPLHAGAHEPPPLNAWPTVRITMTAEEDYAKARRAIFEVMNRHDFDFRGEDTDRLVFNRGRRFEHRTAPPPLPRRDFFGRDQLFTQIAFDYVPDWRARTLTIVARPTRYAIDYSVVYGVERATLVTSVESQQMKGAHYARILQRELDLIRARLENPARPVIYSGVYP